MEQRLLNTEETDLVHLRELWIDQLTARKVVRSHDTDITAAISRLDSAISNYISRDIHESDRKQIFDDVDIYRDTGMVTAYKRLAQMATAWATPGSIYYSCEKLLRIIINGLDDGHRFVYNPQRQEAGNWWSWEIGVPKALADTIALIATELNSDQLYNYCASIDHFIPDPTLQFSEARGRRPSEGANRVDICQAIIVRSIVGLDSVKLRAAVSSLTPVWQYVCEGNGLYRDGSLIQHSTIPYTGTYGVVLLAGLAKLFALLGDSPFEINDPSRVILFDAVEKSFAPFIHNGQMIDSVRGRATSRRLETAFDNGAYAIEAILRLADTVGGSQASRWRSMCRGWIERNCVRSPLAMASIPRTALIKNLLSLPLPAYEEVPGHCYFPAMDRSVYRSREWAVALNLTSRRVATHEAGNGENNNGYHIGSGMTALYASDSNHFEDAFWPTADLHRLPGITVDASPPPNSAHGEWGRTTILNDWTGGTSLGTIGAVGMHLHAPNGVQMEARKSWFFFGNMIVALGSGILSKTGYHVETVVEHRNTGDRVGNLTVDGFLQSPEFEVAQIRDAPTWAHLEGVAGYVFLDGRSVSFLQEKRVGAWSDISSMGDDTLIEREYTTIAIDHGISPSNATYAYCVLPGASIDDMNTAVDDTNLLVLRNDAEAQGVALNGYQALNFWTGTSIGSFSTSVAACIITREVGMEMELVIVDPTQTADTVSIIISGSNYSSCSPRDKIDLMVLPNGDTQIDVRTAGLAGQGIEFRLTR